MTIPLELESIRIDGDTQARVIVDDRTIAHYADCLSGGDKLPPLKVVFDGASNWLWDGFHTYHAARRAGLTYMQAEVTKGTLEDARWLASGANKEHDRTGKARTNKDKRKAVEMALATEHGKKRSDRAIADHVGVDHKTVAAIKEKLSGEFPQIADKQVERNGKTYTMNTENIGKSKPPVERSGLKFAPMSESELASIPDGSTVITDSETGEAIGFASAPTPLELVQVAYLELTQDDRQCFCEWLARQNQKGTPCD